MPSQKDEETGKRVRQQVDFGSETHQNRYGCRAVSVLPTERILLVAPRRIGQSAAGTHDQYADEHLEKS